MNTLLVTYLPKGDSSNTKKLVDHFLAQTVESHEINHVELSDTPPSMMVKDNLFAYMKRAFMGQQLNSQELELMNTADTFTQQLIEADNLVVATPVHNFSVPGIVKVWLDNVVQKGMTFDFDANGPVGLMKGKKAMVLYTAGFWYSENHFDADWNTVPEVMEANLAYMGYDPISIIGVDGINAKAPERVEEDYTKAFNEITTAISTWK